MLRIDFRDTEAKGRETSGSFFKLFGRRASCYFVGISNSVICLFWILVLQKTLESPLDSKENRPGNPKRNQPWILFGRTDAEAPILWPPDEKSQFIGRYLDNEKDWRQEEKRMTEDEMVRWHHWLNVHELGQALGDGEERLACSSPRGLQELDVPWCLNNNNVCLYPTTLLFNQAFLLTFKYDVPHLKIAIFHLLSFIFDDFHALLTSFQSGCRNQCLRQSGLPSWIWAKWVKRILQHQLSQRRSRSSSTHRCEGWLFWRHTVSLLLASWLPLLDVYKFSV